MIAVLVPMTLIQLFAAGGPWTGPVVTVPAWSAIAVIMFGYRRLPAAALPVAVLSLLFTLVIPVLGVVLSPALWLAEIGGLLVITLWTVRLWDAKWGSLTVGMLLAALLLLLPVRQAPANSAANTMALLVLTMFGVIVAVSWGVYLRSIDVRRRRALAGVQRNERLELARDLHDFVAHHVTGIVVQAQAAQYIPADDRRKVAESFASIEAAGLEALASMRRLVGVLRDDDAGAGVRPLGDLDQLRSLVERFSVGDVYASLHIGADLAADRLPPEVAATAYRVVQEALTNVRKHGSHVTTVTVSVVRSQHGIDVSVRDNGRSSMHRSPLSGMGGGYGLAGLVERLAALGGSLTAGRRPEGGWEVHAKIPFAAGGSADAMSSTATEGYP